MKNRPISLAKPLQKLIYFKRSVVKLSQNPVLLYTYEDKESAENGFKRLIGEKRLASERDGGETIYNLFGIANWKNLYELELYNLKELEQLIKNKESFNHERRAEIIKTLNAVAKLYGLKIPQHWIE